jgi:sigma-E factor negative regulatory protein RseA
MHRVATMITVKEELLSACVDEEASELEVRHSCKEMLNNERELARWGRYHLMRDVLRGNLTTRIDLEFATKVMAMVAAEPPLTGTARRTWGEQLFKPVAGFGLAASVAVAAVLGFQALTDSSSDASRVMPAASIASSAPASRVRVAKTSVDPAPTPSMIRNPDVAAKLNSYLVGHSELALSRGMMPYARVVAGYEGSQR